MPVHYRSPTLADAEAIARLHVASWREAYGGIVPQEILDRVDVEDRTARWREYLSGDGVTVLAEDGGEAAGFIRSGPLAEPMVEGADGHIFALYVLRRHHRLGIGGALLGRTAAAWLARGGKALSVGVLTQNARARAFYEATGARFVRAESYQWDGHSLPESIYLYEDLPAVSRLA